MIKKNLTIYDIAKEAEVSPSTVSRVLTGNAKVSPEKAQKVQSIIDKYQFAPNALASGLKAKKSKVIGVIIPDIKNPYFAHLFYEVQVSAAKEGYMVFLCNTDGKKEVEEEMVEVLLNKQIEALVLIGGATDHKDCSKTYLKKLQEIARIMPVVITNNRKELDCFKVTNNDEQGMALLAHYLSKKGYKKVAFIGGTEGAIPTSVRRKHFLSYAKKEKLVVKKEWLLEGGYEIESGKELMRSLWKQEEKPEVICGINDLVAQGILSYIGEKGFKVPEHIGVMGCDGITQAKILYPSLSSIGTQYSEFGQKIIALILEALDQNVQPTTLQIEMKLIEGQSTK